VSRVIRRVPPAKGEEPTRPSYDERAARHSADDVTEALNRVAVKTGSPMDLFVERASRHVLERMESGSLEASHRPPPRRAAQAGTYGSVGGMEKTTVYLTDAQKRALSHAARLSGRSEAELIREGIDTVTAKHAASEPTLPLFDSGQPDLAERVDELLRGFGEE
jgi:predicted transcriptional regulator